MAVLIACFGIYVYSVRDIEPPKILDSSIDNVSRVDSDSNSYSLGNNWLQQNKYGLYEMYLEGKPYERGVIYGKLANELLFAQEKAFTNEIKRMI